MRRLLMFCLSLTLILLASLAGATSVYINGVKVDGVVGLKMHGVDVEIDAAGDVRISAKGYSVDVKEPPKPPAPPPKTQAPPKTTATAPRYWLGATAHGSAQWDIDVYVNGQLVRRFSGAAAPIDVTRMLHGGDNTVHVRATKQEGIAQSISPAEYLEISLGEGAGGGESFFSYRRTAAETGQFTSDATITIK